MLVQASSGDVGTVAVQLVKHLGAQVATTVGPDILVMAEELVQCSMLGGAYAAANLASWLGANRSDTQRYREDLQRRQGGKGAVA